MCELKWKLTTTYCTAYLTDTHQQAYWYSPDTISKAKLWAGVARQTCYWAYKGLVRSTNLCLQGLFGEALPKISTIWKTRTDWDWDTVLLVTVTWRVFKTRQREMGGNNMSHQASECVCAEGTKWEKFGNLSPVAAYWKIPAYWCHRPGTHCYTVITQRA